MTIDFYYAPDSTPCRAVQMTAKAVGIDLNHIHIDLEKAQHLSPEYIKLNPQHNVPMIIDNGFSLTESRAIISYLVDKYGKSDDPLYPKDAQKRALINQRLYFDLGTFYAAFGGYFYPVMYRGATEIDESIFPKVEQALGFLNVFLEGQTYVAGATLTIADISLLASLSMFEHEEGYPLAANYPNVARWFSKVKTVAPGNDVNEAGVQLSKKYFATFHKLKKK